MKRKLLLPMMLALVASSYSTTAGAQNWSGSTIGAAKNKTVYLWNVGAQKFLGKGGRWGTEAVISNVGTPFKVVAVSSSTYRLESIVKGEGSSTSNGALSFMNGTNSKHDAGNYFVDRSSDDDTYGVRTFTFSGDQAGYQLKVTSSGGVSSTYDGTFYLFANMEGDGKAKGYKTVPTDSTAYSRWIIVTEDERKSYFEKAEASESSAVPATFLMFDYGFDRNDNYATKWQTKSSKEVSDFDGTLSWKGNTECEPSDAYPWTKTTTYYTYTYMGSHKYTYWYKSYTHNVTYTLTTTTPPAEQAKTLEISCDLSTTSASYSHTKEKVTVTLDASKTTSETKNESSDGYVYYNGNGYVESTTTLEDEDGNTLSEATHQQELYGGDWTANIHGSYGVVNQTIPNANMIREGWYKVSCVGFTTATTGTVQLYASAGTSDVVGKYYAVQPLVKLAADKQPVTYVKASKLVNGGGYCASVMVYVGKNDADNLKTLSFGILVDGAESSAWTCFDDFQIDYLGMPNEPLVLDEEQTDVAYINKQTTPSGETNQKKTLYLHRTLNADKWNSIVLPVNLTVGQVQSAFGDNAKLSVFKGAINQDKPNRMYFEAVDVDRNNKNAIAIEEGKLYIIKPTKEEPSDQETVEMPNATGVNKALNAYFTIPGVTFNDNRVTYINKVEGDAGNETYGGASQVRFVGTYVSDSSDGKNPSIPTNSYVLNGNNVGGEIGLWYYRTIQTPTKGFRGWLQVLNQNAAKQISFSINGIVDENDVTAIEDIKSDLQQGGIQGDVYNLGGQLIRVNATSLEGLAKGVYIVNGKKIVVK